MRRVSPAEAGSGFNKPAYPGLRYAPSWANPIFTPSGFEHSQFQSGANRARAALRSAQRIRADNSRPETINHVSV
jgi:hypothetical protein